MNDWISVKDKLPDVNFKWYLIATKDGDGNRISTLSFFERRECKGDSDEISWLAHNDHGREYDEWDNVTHWMIVPPPPK